jgi:hypothetical protein
MNRSELLKIISNDPEPVYGISGMLCLKNEAEKKELWRLLKEIAFNGSDRERFVVLTLISCENQSLAKEIVDSLIDEVRGHFSEKRAILPPLIRIVDHENITQYVPDLLDILRWADKHSDTQIKSMSFRAILSLDWQQALHELIDIIEKEQDIKIIDTCSYLIYKNNENAFNTLVSELDDASAKKVKKLLLKVLDRLKNNYEQLS